MALFCIDLHVLSDPFQISSWFQWLLKMATIVIQMKFFGGTFIFKGFSSKYKSILERDLISSVTLTRQIIWCSFILLPKQCRCLWIVDKCFTQNNWRFWLLIPTSSEKMIGWVCYISIILSKSNCLFVKCVFHFVFHQYVQLLPAAHFSPYTCLLCVGGSRLPGFLHQRLQHVLVPGDYAGDQFGFHHRKLQSWVCPLFYFYFKWFLGHV